MIKNKELIYYYAMMVGGKTWAVDWQNSLKSYHEKFDVIVKSDPLAALLYGNDALSVPADGLNGSPTINMAGQDITQFKMVLARACGRVGRIYKAPNPAPDMVGFTHEETAIKAKDRSYINPWGDLAAFNADYVGSPVAKWLKMRMPSGEFADVLV